MMPFIKLSEIPDLLKALWLSVEGSIMYNIQIAISFTFEKSVFSKKNHGLPLHYTATIKTFTQPQTV